MAVRSQSWRTNADAFIVNQLFVNNVGHVDIYAFPELLYGSDYVFSIDGDTIQVPYQNCVGYFIDLMPFAHWAHPCKYCFVDASNHYTIIDAEMPPQCNYLVPVSLLPRVNPAPMTFAVDTTAPRIVQHDNSNHLWAVLICGDECESHFRDDCLIPEYWFDLSSVYTVLTNKFGYQEASTTYGDPSDRRIIVSAPTALKNRYTFQQYDLNGNNSYNSNTGVAVGDFFDYNETTETKHSKATIDSIFKCFAGDEHCLQVYHDQGLVELTEEDQLFIFVTGIGRRDDGLNKSYFTVHDMGQDRERIYDDEFASLLRGIKCSQMTLVMANNYSGGFVDEFMNDISHPDCQCKNRIAQSAASADGYAYGEEHNVYYNNSGNYASCVTEFVYYWASSALGYYPYFNTYDGSVGPWSVPSVGRKVGDGSMNWSHYFGTVSEQQNPHALYDVNPDSDNDGILSLREMFEFANDLDSWSEEGYYNSAYDPAYYSWYVPEEPQQQYESTYTKEAATLVGYEGQIDSIANSGTAVQPYRLCGDIWVSSDSELTMWDEVQAPENVRIYVKPSGKLILDGATLTNLPEEHSPMWKGVQVWGNRDKHQFKENGEYWQGFLEMKNGATIRNAVIGIDVWNPNDDKSSGGIVKASDAHFNNNTTAVCFHPYENQFEHPHQQGNMVIRDNVSYFKNCEFSIDEKYIGPNLFEMHANLFRVRGVGFYGCRFSYDDNAYSSLWPIGLHAWDAGFKLGGVCTSGSQVYPCQQFDNSSFDGFYKAVVSVNDGSVGIRPMTVKNTDFTNNSFGVFAVRSGYPLILNSTFSIGKDNNQCAAGIFAEQTPAFIIEQDTFGIAPQHPFENFGVVIKNSKSQNQIYKNTFKGLYCANLSIGRNNTWMMPRNTTDAKSDILGLEYRCNENTDNLCDFYVLGGNSYYKLGIQTNQGALSVPANNTFSEYSRYQFINHGNNGINYYYDPNLTNGTPNINNIYGVTLKTTMDSIGCPSHYTFGGISYNDTLTPVLSVAQRLQRETDYYEAYSAYNAIKTVYDGMINGGDTEEEIADISSATPSDMWQLRSQLLGHSPHLTDEVLFSMLGRDDVFPQSVYFEILASNPDELKNDTLFNYLQNMDNPLPEYMIGLLRQMADGVTARTAMESQMAHYSQRYRQAASDMIRSILCDSIIDKTSLVGWLGNMRDLESDREIVSIYLEEGNYTDAFALANMLPTLYGLSSDDLTEHNDYLALLNLYSVLNADKRNTMQLDSTERASVEYIAEFGTGTPQAMAKSIMMGAYGYRYNDCPGELDLDYPINGRGNVVTSSISDADLNKAMGFSIAVSPNPANTWIAVDYTLPAGATKAQMRIVNALGMTVGTYDLQGKETQKVLDLRDLTSGVYTYTVFCGKYSQNGKLVIVK
jgi:hypothetical protein